MSRRHIASKMIHHAQLATDAWVHNSLNDYAIESARFELALRMLNRQDVKAQALLDSMDLGLC